MNKYQTFIAVHPLLHMVDIRTSAVELGNVELIYSDIIGANDHAIIPNIELKNYSLIYMEYSIIQHVLIISDRSKNCYIKL